MDTSVTHRIAAGAVALSLLAGGGVLAGCGSSSSSSEAATTAAADTSTQPANGIEKLPATEILSTSLAAANEATSVTVRGSYTEEGQETSLNLVLGADSAAGSITTQGIKIDVRVTGGKSYFKMSAEDFAKIAGQDDAPEITEAVSALLGDKWLLVPADSGSDEFEGFSELADKDSLLKGILAAEGEVSISGTDDVNGIPVVLLDDSEGDGTLAIQTMGEPYPVQLAGNDQGESGQITFSDWNAPVSVTAPTDVVDIDELVQNLAG
jgi:hypothetical protein